jgi:hypothetical protein
MSETFRLQCSLFKRKFQRQSIPGMKTAFRIGSPDTNQIQHGSPNGMADLRSIRPQRDKTWEGPWVQLSIICNILLF